VQWVNLNVSLNAGVYDNFDLGDTRAGAPVDSIPTFRVGRFDRYLLLRQGGRVSEVLKAKGDPYQFVFSEAAGHVDQRVQLQTMVEAFEWVWKGYKPGGK
jgi:hypothetical protein